VVCGIVGYLGMQRSTGCYFLKLIKLNWGSHA